jgi:glutathione S-transferase
MITVHHLDQSRSQRILWLLEELGLDYTITRYERDPKTMRAPAALRAIHPLGKSPVLTDGDEVLVESGAIVEYFVERYGAATLAPKPGTPERRRYTYWLHYAEGSAMPPLLLKLIFSRMPANVPALIRPVARLIANAGLTTVIEPQLRLHLDFMKAELGKSQWFAGPDFSAADIQMSFPIEAAAARAGLGADRPKLAAYLEHIRARSAYQRAIDKGGPLVPLR